MNREKIVRDLNSEMEVLIRLHRHGLYNTAGYRDRKHRIKDFVLKNGIDIRRELDPVSLVLYRRYID